jgi:hypothetical protein
MAHTSKLCINLVRHGPEGQGEKICDGLHIGACGRIVREADLNLSRMLHTDVKIDDASGFSEKCDNVKIVIGKCSRIQGGLRYTDSDSDELTWRGTH